MEACDDERFFALLVEVFICENQALL